ncbi:MAG: DUF2933 domain-containing protein [Burkholderiaceae bacterium]|nr:DUF2933 domain-containing protein [Burkholderiaceae bacterium]
MNSTNSVRNTLSDDRSTRTASERLSQWVPALGALAMALVVGGFYLFREHLDPADASWLYLLLLACPLIHLFAHEPGRGDTADGAATRTESAPRL